MTPKSMLPLAVSAALLGAAPAAGQTPAPIVIQPAVQRSDLEFERYRAHADALAAGAAQADAETQTRLRQLEVDRAAGAAPPRTPQPRVAADPRSPQVAAQARERAVERQLGEIDAWLAAAPHP